MKGKIMLLAGVLVTTLYCSNIHAITVETAKKLSWHAEGKRELLRNFSNVQAVNEFVGGVLPKPQEGDPAPDIKNFAFADLDNSGSLELVCSLSDGGRFYPTVLVVSNVNGEFVYSKAYNGGGMDVPDIDKIIVDTNGHGQIGLVIPRRVGPYQGTRPVPIVYDIYEFKDNHLQRNNLKYINYYRTKLIPGLRSELQEKMNVSSSDNAEIDTRRTEEITALRTGIEVMEKTLNINASSPPAH
jgi:hypothetical protein